MQNTFNDLNEYEDVLVNNSSQIGYGAYSLVRRVKNKKTGVLYALKEVRISKFLNKIRWI